MTAEQIMLDHLRRVDMDDIVHPLTGRKIDDVCPWWQTVREAAAAKFVPELSLAAAMLVRASLTNPYNLMLPATLGAPASTGLYCAVVGEPGQGKSSVQRLAGQIVKVSDNVAKTAGIDDPDGAWAAAFPSGEGVSEWLKQQEVEVNEVKTKTQRRCVLMEFDEGDFLTKTMSREGNSLESVVKSAFTAGQISQQNASADRKRTVKENSYNAGLILGTTPDTAGKITDNVAGGFAQRWLTFPAVRRSVKLTAEMMAERLSKSWNPVAICEPVWDDGPNSKRPKAGTIGTVALCNELTNLIKSVVVLKDADYKLPDLDDDNTELEDFDIKCYEIWTLWQAIEHGQHTPLLLCKLAYACAVLNAATKPQLPSGAKLGTEPTANPNAECDTVDADAFEAAVLLMMASARTQRAIVEGGRVAREEARRLQHQQKKDEHIDTQISTAEAVRETTANIELDAWALVAQRVADGKSAQREIMRSVSRVKAWESYAAEFSNGHTKSETLSRLIADMGDAPFLAQGKQLGISDNPNSYFEVTTERIDNEVKVSMEPASDIDEVV